MNEKLKLWVRTFRDDQEIGEPVLVKGAPTPALMRVFLDRCFEADLRDGVPNYAVIEESDGSVWGANPSAVKILFATGYAAATLAEELDTMNDEAWSVARGD